MFDALVWLAEAIWGLFEATAFIADIVIALADIYSWFRGRPNRIERKQARSSGEPIPPRDHWNRRVLWLTALVVILTTVLLARYLNTHH